MGNLSRQDLDTELFILKDCNPILFPLVFNMSVLSGEPTTDYQVFEQVRIFNENNKGLEKIDLFKGTKFTHQDLRSFYSAQLKFLLRKKTKNIFNEQFKQLCDYLENPFHYFLMKHDHEGDIVEIELLEEFPELLDEVSRDNVVTDNEKELLIERANELGLPVEKIDHLQNKRFIGYKTFRILVDQVCEDGVITDREHSFILEKADQYNVPKKIVSKLLKKGLAKVKILKEKSVDEDFYLYIISFFVLRFVEKSIGKNIIDENLTKKIFNVDSVTSSSILAIHGDVLSALEKSLSTYLNTDIKINNVNVFLKNLGLNTLSRDEAIKRYKSNIEGRTLEDFQKKYTSSTKEFKGFLYQLDYKSMNSNELFTHKVEGDEVVIQINIDHPLFIQSTKQVEVIEFFIITLISTKFEYTNNKHVNHFWNLFKLYQQHFTLTSQ